MLNSKILSSTCCWQADTTSFERFVRSAPEARSGEIKSVNVQVGGFKDVIGALFLKMMLVGDSQMQVGETYLHFCLPYLGLFLCNDPLMFFSSELKFQLLFTSGLAAPVGF